MGLLSQQNASMKGSLNTAKAKLTEDGDEDADDTIASTGPSQSARGGGGGNPFAGLAGLGGGGGGMPDLSSILNNPQMMQMAQSMMACVVIQPFQSK